jgi:hypothetical protein
MGLVGSLNDYVPNTTIVSADVEADFAALKAGINTAVFADEATTVSVTHDWNAVQDFAGGAVSAPGIYLAGETTTGIYRIGANNHGYAVSGSKVLDISSTGLGVTGTLTASSSGPHAIGGAVDGQYALSIRGAFTSSGASTTAAALAVRADITGAAGDTGFQALIASGQNIGGSITTGGNSETIADVATAILYEPDLTVGAGDTVTNASTLKIVNAPTEGSNNYALWVDAGATRLDGTLDVTGDTTLGTATITTLTLTNGFSELTIDQGAADTFALRLQSDDVVHGITSGAIETITTNDYFVVQKGDADQGGALIIVAAEDDTAINCLNVFTYGGTASTTKTTAGQGLVNVVVAENSGANGPADITSNGNVFSVRAHVSSGYVTRLLVDEDGDLYSVTAAQTFDDEDDLALVEAYDRTRDTVRRDYAEFCRYNETDLVRVGVLGAPIAEGGMTNVTQLQRLHNGALRQMAGRINELESQLKRLAP